VSDNTAFEEWVVLNREWLQRQVLGALRRLAQTLEKDGDISGALPFAWRQVELEPWSEEAHRYLMRLLALRGRRGEALAQYGVCQRALAKELDVEPSSETTRLYEQIRAGEIAPLPQVQKIEPPPVAPAAIQPEPLSPASKIERPEAGGVLSRRVKIAIGGLLVLSLSLAAIFSLSRQAAFRPAVAPAKGKSVIFAPVTIDQPILGGRLAWSPDGRRIFCAYDAGNHVESTLLLDANGQNVVKQNLEIPTSWFQDFWPQWGSGE
jgi:hypothetical protein